MSVTKGDCTYIILPATCEHTMTAVSEQSGASTLHADYIVQKGMSP